MASRPLTPELERQWREVNAVPHLSDERVTVLLAEIDRLRGALWLCGAFVEMYDGRALDKPRAERVLRGLGIARWPAGGPDNPRVLTSPDDVAKEDDRG